MEIKSSAFLNNESLPVKYTCDGEGVNPPLEFFGVPLKSQSLVLVVWDPDAPNGTWYHWLVWNIPPQTTSLGENSVPEGATVGKGSDGQNKYGPACPPFGVHHYIFTLYALDNILDLPSGTDFENLEMALGSHVLAKAQLTVLYARQK